VAYNRNLFLAILEAGKSKIKVPTELRARFLTASLLSLSSRDGREKGLSRVFFIRVVTAFLGLHP
jgi:hypothetical protein